MHYSRRTVLASGSGMIAGLAGCSHTINGTPTPESVAKVYIADGIIAFEPRGMTLYGQLNADGLEAKTLDDGDSFDPATGSFSVSGTDTARIAFASDSLAAVTIIAESGAFDVFNRGSLVQSRARRVSLGPESSSGKDTAANTRSAENGQAATVYISQKAVLFETSGVTLSGQIGAQTISGENLETTDELDSDIGKFTLSGSGSDRIRFEEGSLEAISIIADNGRFDVFYRGNLLERSSTRFSRLFQGRPGTGISEKSIDITISTNSGLQQKYAFVGESIASADNGATNVDPTTIDGNEVVCKNVGRGVDRIRITGLKAFFSWATVETEPSRGVLKEEFPKPTIHTVSKSDRPCELAKEFASEDY